MSLTKRHQRHYTYCNCLADSSECCIPTCECHPDAEDPNPVEVKHVVFNPTPWGTFDSPLRSVVENMEAEGWVLVKVVPHHTHESVAVFERGKER